MAKTIMISDKLYGELKKIKDDKSFTETILYFMKNSRKTGSGLREVAGSLPKNDKEYEGVFKALRPSYKKWSKKYA
ncbi:MAG: antitoxin VapB family protein [Candidatus Woesearchaeota archaeon]